MRRLGLPPRTEESKVTAALLFVAQARDHILLGIIADQLCDRHGISRRDDRRRVEAYVLAAQGKVRRRAEQSA